MIDRILVVGAGQMGAGIAQVAAVGGFDVTLSDVAPGQLERAMKGIQGSLTKLAEKGRIEPAVVDESVLRIRTSAEPADADLLIEAATEDVDLKLRIFRDLDAAAGDGAVLASNTSSIPITRLAAATRRPERVVGMHFMNPVPLMPLVEVIRGIETSDETLAAVVSTAERMGKTVAQASDFPGFISNRILVPMINEAVYCLMEGVGDRESIDTVMKLGMSHPLGPLQLADLIGLDTLLAVSESLYEEFRDSASVAPALLNRMVEAGLLGRKSGRGFYDYRGEHPVPTR